MPDHNYLFIDGGYLRECYSRTIRGYFREEGKLHFPTIRGNIGVTRVFYYDCLHDVPKKGESDSDFKQRVIEQSRLFDEIQNIPGFHVRLGSLSGKPPRLRQKKVDVLLAVEALDHAFRRNMAHAYLIAGDLDFAPLVDTLVRNGTYVTVMYEKTSPLTRVVFSRRYRAAVRYCNAIPMEHTRVSGEVQDPLHGIEC
jgi:uncharacterized LabA/DUF88 family protein